MSIYSRIVEKKAAGKKQFAVLVDPDKPDDKSIEKVARLGEKSGVDYFFVGGSLLTTDSLDHCIKILKANSNIPVVLFPGNTLQMSGKADAFLYLSLISGRNAEMLIGRHVISAPYLKLSSLEVISTGYMLIDSGKPTTVSYMSNSSPIPADKVDIAACTAMAGEMLGMKLIYMDAGSGAKNPVSAEMINMVRLHIEIPLIIGGGIKSAEKAIGNAKSGADLIVVGNSIESDPQLIPEISEALHAL
ncbi:MAG: geranylgeranylglyceryl/heptaprenylglyceryl phosphate synthase [Bacteroidales bacterium]|nr:geranylgeranylglyceryl/heptaprenylglyceryl phosphate synthase [Bacteroidales bacterium]MCF8343139.1 geranylgeranylglyceryl/heptaprenylglyceryl phosphate synthase [Bacteroidales bacterium]MCF8351548.1 geranylgeranylglyceryl/heptaprenylglyceryl phosphate synthase [Bacteroidales bacterium]MCF8376499.1 geranylgeranylglyceryl/heptaprenylglyceryl phosphate synthase [Bacteroidales bacterium]MCF8401501.1 geranylgeranylglyceryl/heptaprenylglyceryl phosphate synthase [Bacteroidales bacterium]